MWGVLYMGLFFAVLIGSVIFIQKKLMKSKKFAKLIGLDPDKKKEENNKKEEQVDLERIFNSSMSWFFWIAGLSIVNTFLILISAGWGFIFGMTATNFFDYSWHLHFSEYALIDLIISIILYIFILGSIALAGFLSKKRYIWAIWVGLMLIILDGGLALYAGDYWGLLFHAFVIFKIITGYMVLRRLGKENNVSIKNQSGKQKIKFLAYLIFNVIIIFFFWVFFLYDAGV